MVSEGQETCFACGMKVRLRKRRSGKPVNVVLLVVAGLVVAAATGSFIAIQSGAARRRAAQARTLAQERAQDSLKRAREAVQDSLKSMTSTAQEIGDRTTELRREEQRFEAAYERATQGRPTPGLIQQAGAIRTEISTLRKLITSIGLTFRETERLQIRAKIKEAMDRMNGLIDQIESAPRPKAAPGAGRGREPAGSEKQPTGKPPSGRTPHQKSGR
jgi:hypothetical protein